MCPPLKWAFRCFISFENEKVRLDGERFGMDQDGMAETAYEGRLPPSALRRRARRGHRVNGHNIRYVFIQSSPPPDLTQRITKRLSVVSRNYTFRLCFFFQEKRQRSRRQWRGRRRQRRQPYLHRQALFNRWHRQPMTVSTFIELFCSTPESQLGFQF